MVTVAGSWREAKELAESEGQRCIYHDVFTGEYGACSPELRRQRSANGMGEECRRICMPARMSIEEIEHREQEMLRDPPEWMKEI